MNAKTAKLIRRASVAVHGPDYKLVLRGEKRKWLDAPKTKRFMFRREMRAIIRDE